MCKKYLQVFKYFEIGFKKICFQMKTFTLFEMENLDSIMLLAWKSTPFQTFISKQKILFGNSFHIQFQSAICRCYFGRSFVLVKFLIVNHCKYMHIKIRQSKKTEWFSLKSKYSHFEANSIRFFIVVNKKSIKKGYLHSTFEMHKKNPPLWYGTHTTFLYLTLQ